VAEAAPTRAKPGVELVDASFDAAAVVAAGLVAEGVGQGLDRLVAGDAVAVEVEQGVELAEREAAVATQDRQARGAQGAAPEHAVRSREGAERGTSTWGRSPAVVGRDQGPELVAQIFEGGQHGDAALVEPAQLAVDEVQLGEQLVTFDLEVAAFGRTQV
jgi:hypothetical protein